MAKKYNFSETFRQEKIMYVYLGFTVLQIKGRGLNFFLYLFLVIVVAVLFMVLRILFPITIAFLLSGIVIIVGYNILDATLDTKDGGEVTPLELFLLKRKATNIIYTASNEKIYIQKKYKTEGVRLYGLSRKFSADWERDCGWRYGNVHIPDRSNQYSLRK